MENSNIIIFFFFLIFKINVIPLISQKNKPIISTFLKAIHLYATKKMQFIIIKNTHLNNNCLRYFKFATNHYFHINFPKMQRRQIQPVTKYTPTTHATTNYLCHILHIYYNIKLLPRTCAPFLLAGKIEFSHNFSHSLLN